MAFNVTYGYLQEKNLNHLYTTRDYGRPRNKPRHKLYRSELLQLEREANDRSKQHRARKCRDPTMEYVSEFDIEVARAPAFSYADEAYIEEMIARLTKKPDIQSNPRSCAHYLRGFVEYEDGLQKTESPRDPVSKRKMKGTLDRLSKPGGCGRRHPTPPLKEDDSMPNFIF